MLDDYGFEIFGEDENDYSEPMWTTYHKQKELEIQQREATTPDLPYKPETVTQPAKPVQEVKEKRHYNRTLEIVDARVIETELFKHQKLARRRYYDENAIALFFEPGCGKSLTAIRIAEDKFRRGMCDVVLIIAPNKIDTQWAREEIPKWSEVRHSVWNNKKSKKQIPYNEGCLNYLCINVDQFSTQNAYLRVVEYCNQHDTIIILDEATVIKNPKALRTQRILYEFNDIVRRGRTLISSTPKTVARMILTGTPITNGPFDVWAMFEFLQPGFFGMNWYAFQNKYGMFHTIDVNGRNIRILINEDIWKAVKACNSYEYAMNTFGISMSTYDYIKEQDHYEGPFRNVEFLRQNMCKLAMFVRLTDVVDMPTQTFVRRLVDMSPEQARVYYEMERYLITTYKDKEVSATTKLTSYIRLQQIADGFVVSQEYLESHIDGEDDDPPENVVTWIDKPAKLERIKVDLTEINGPVVIVCKFSAEAAKLYEELTKEGYKCGLMTGWKTIGGDTAFKNGDVQIMIANIRVIRMGFNWQHCTHMLFYSNTFSLEDRDQVTRRIWRIGQTNPCIYIDYVATDTIDMKVFAALKQKKSIADYVKNNSIEQMLTEQDDVFKEEFGDIIF